MRRAIAVIAVTVGGLALVASFHTSPGGVPLTTGPSSTETTAPPDTSATRSSAREGPTTSSRRGTRSDTTTLGSAPPPTTSPSTTGPQAARAVDGPVVTTSYGDVQVRVTLNGKRLADVQALKLPSDRSRSVRISQNAGPKLRAEALQAQGAHINLVSGATYTSQGYIDSLQGALDQAP